MSLPWFASGRLVARAAGVQCRCDVQLLAACYVRINSSCVRRLSCRPFIAVLKVQPTGNTKMALDPTETPVRSLAEGGSGLRTALVYDFDGTLAPGNIQEHALIPEYLQTTSEAFWHAVGEEKREDDADEILVYLRRLIVRARELERPLTRDVLRRHGARTPLF